MSSERMKWRHSRQRSGTRAAERLALLAVILLVLAGCNYGFEGGGFPSSIRTLYIAPFENETPQFGLEQKLYATMLDRLPGQLGVRIGGEETADAIVRGSIVRYDNVAQNYRPGTAGQPAADVVSHEVQIGVKVQLIDVHRNVVLWDSQSLVGKGSYRPNEDSDQVAQTTAIQDLIKQMVDGAQSQW